MAATPSIQGGELPVRNEEPLLRELADFVDAIASRRAPAVDGAAGRRALALATQITDKMASGFRLQASARSPKPEA
jgi:predicted dehydrogenase